MGPNESTCRGDLTPRYLVTRPRYLMTRPRYLVTRPRETSHVIFGEISRFRHFVLLESHHLFVSLPDTYVTRRADAIFKPWRREELAAGDEDVRSRRTTGPARVRGSPEIIVTILGYRGCQGLLQPQGQVPVPRVPYFELLSCSPGSAEHLSYRATSSCRICALISRKEIYIDPRSMRMYDFICNVMQQVESFAKFNQCKRIIRKHIF
ncbi:hypothetical protein CDAR_41111 [Caerostris darwini]|uniref:Uncharacterized protein n=1 Tax=Caerostris darwini TaxID=1538125 RepID=A0AAV4W4D8_9ARAC|nr:hypothetical protein CDAR_41111 [Caerostris darwini]